MLFGSAAGVGAVRSCLGAGLRDRAAGRELRAENCGARAPGRGGAALHGGWGYIGGSSAGWSSAWMVRRREERRRRGGARVGAGRGAPAARGGPGGAERERAAAHAQARPVRAPASSEAGLRAGCSGVSRYCGGGRGGRAGPLAGACELGGRRAALGAAARGRGAPPSHRAGAAAAGGRRGGGGASGAGGGRRKLGDAFRGVTGGGWPAVLGAGAWVREARRPAQRAWARARAAEWGWG
jgi:hypothetical protein